MQNPRPQMISRVERVETCRSSTRSARSTWFVAALLAFGLGAFAYHLNLNETSSASAEKTKKGDSGKWW